jgi:hypothetical protein
MNPFARDRYEYTPNHLYYLPDELITRLEDSKPSCVIGSRGSGKTTLLKALNWEERQRNQSLNRQLSGDAFRGQFIATYTKLPLVQVGAFQSWLKSAGDVAHAALFGFYFDLISAQSIAHSMSSIVSTNSFAITISAEEHAVTDFLNDCDYLLVNQNRKITTLIECHDLIRGHRRKLESAAIASRNHQELLEQVTVPTIGQLPNALGLAMSKVLDQSKIGNGQRWHFKCCYDEAECLNRRQLIVANSVIRTSSWPVSYVFSFVGEPTDLSLTIHEGLTVQRADRSIIHLDELDRNQFEHLCDGVATVRIQSSLASLGVEPDKAFEFKTTRTLGELNLNVIIKELIQRSENPFRSTLREMAETYSKLVSDKKNLTDDPLPYIEAYLAQQLKLQPSNFESPEEKRSQSSREFRKKFVASYLSICRELSIKKIPYAFAKMVFGISDSCIRDYLAQMYQIFEKQGVSLQRFLESEIDWQTQSDAIHAASEEKRKSIRTGEEVSNPERVRRLTVAFGELTGLLQSGDQISNIHLRSSERGLFHFGSAIVDSGQDHELFTILKDACEAGFLRLKREGSRILAFRVHASIAPSYGYSYRGAYYPVSIQRSELNEILNTADDEELEKIAKRISGRFKRGGSESTQQLLFKLDDLGEQADDRE